MARVDLSNDTKNWLKAALALTYLKEGLRPFVDQHISEFHNNLIATYGTCNQCTTENVLKCPTNKACWKNKKGICQYHDNRNPLRQSRPCPNGVCDNIHDAIVREHFMRQPMWNNTDAAKWSSDAWEVAKCFLPPGSKDVPSSADTDCTGILSLCLHCLPLIALIGHVKQDFEQNRFNRNVVMHSGRQELSDRDRSSFINDAIRLLSTYQSPVSQHTQDCIDTLTEIDSDGLVLTTDNVVGVMKDSVDAIHLKQKELATELQETMENVDANACAIVDHNTKNEWYKGDIKEVDDCLKIVNSVLETFKDQNNEELGKLKNTMETIRKQNEGIVMQMGALETTVKENTERLEKHDVQHTEHDKAHKEHDEILKEHGAGIKEDTERIKENTEGIKENTEGIKKNTEGTKENTEGIKEHTERLEKHDVQHKEHDARIKQLQQRMDHQEDISRSNIIMAASDRENWLKAVLALQYTTDGLTEFVVTEIEMMHQQMLDDLYKGGVAPGTVCSSCTTQNIIKCSSKGICGKSCHIHDASDPSKAYRPCPNHVCDTLMNSITTFHRFDPTWANTDARLWCTNAWEMAKCFLPHGYGKTTSAQDADMTGLLKVIMNNCRFQKKLSEDLKNDKNLFRVALDIRNTLMNSGTLKLSAADLTQYITVLEDILCDPKFLIQHLPAMEAVDKIMKLKMYPTFGPREEEDKLHLLEEIGLDPSILEEIIFLDPKIRELYIKALTEGIEEQTSIRVMMIGHTKAGKTTLTKNILQVDLPEIEQSTNGIDVHVYHANIVDGKLEILDTKDPQEECMKRLAKIAKQKSDQASAEVASCYDSNTSDRVVGRNTAEANVMDETISKDNITEEKKSEVDRVVGRNTTEANVMDQTISKDNITEKKNSEVEGIVQKPVLPPIENVENFQKAYKANQDTSRMLSVWDFGGQFSFYVTHQLFLSDYAIYILVLDLTKDLNTEVEDAFSSNNTRDVETFCKFWLETIHAFVENSFDNPPVVLVGTHFDELDDNEDKEKIAKAKFEEVMTLFDKSPVQRHIHYERFCMSKEQSQDEISKLMTCITNLATKQKQKMPAKWIPLENKLLEMKTSTKHITFHELCELDARNDVPIKVETDLKGFLTFQHRKGNIVYFTEEGLSDIVVLNPQWIIDAFKCIITTEQFCRDRAHLRPLRRQLEEEAMLRPALIAEVWKKSDANNDFGQYKDVLLLYLQQLGIISEECTINMDDITQGTDSEDDTSEDSHRCYIVPSKLKEDSCGKIKELEQSIKSKTLQFVFLFKNGFIPAALYHKVIASAVSKWKLFVWEGKTILYKDGAVFILDSQHVGEIVLTQSSINITVVNLTKENVNPALSNELRQFVDKIITKELNRFRNGCMKGQYDFAFCCDENECQKPLHRLNPIMKCDNVERLVPCSGSKLFHNISVDRLMQEWFPNEPRRIPLVEPRRIPLVEPRRIPLVDLIRNNPSAKMTDKSVNRVAFAIESPFKEFGSALGFDNEDFKQLEKDEPQQEHAKKRRLIFKWRGEKTWWHFLKVLDENPGLDVNTDKLRNILDTLN